MPAHASSIRYRVAHWAVHPDDSTIESADRVVRLQPRVMEVLMYLAERPGEVVSRRELEDNIWTGTVVGYDALTNAIIKLRRALGDNARRPAFIETIPKRGYRLIAPVSQSVEASARVWPFVAAVSGAPGIASRRWRTAAITAAAALALSLGAGQSELIGERRAESSPDAQESPGNGGRTRVATGLSDEAFRLGWQHYQHDDPTGFRVAEGHFRKAVAMNPDHSRAHAALAAIYWNVYRWDWTTALGIDCMKSKSLAEEHRDLAMRKPSALALQVNAEMLAWLGQHDEAIAQSRIALELAPGNAPSMLKLAEIMVYAGHAAEAQAMVSAASSAGSKESWYRAFVEGLAEFSLGRYRESAGAMQRALELNPHVTRTVAVLVAARGKLGHRDADRLIEPYRSEHWALSPVNASLAFPFQRQDDRDRLARGLKLAGMTAVM